MRDNLPHPGVFLLRVPPTPHTEVRHLTPRLHDTLVVETAADQDTKQPRPSCALRGAPLPNCY